MHDIGLDFIVKDVFIRVKGYSTNPSNGEGMLRLSVRSSIFTVPAIDLSFIG